MTLKRNKRFAEEEKDFNDVASFGEAGDLEGQKV